MSSELVTAVADLDAFLVEHCPPAWRVLNAEKLGKAKSTKPVLTFEQLDISQETLGQQLPEGWLWATFQLVLSTPETDAVKGMARLTTEASTLLQILDASPDLRWGPDATRTRLDTGESAFIIPIALLASNYPIPESEPVTEPDAPEEEN